LPSDSGKALAHLIAVGPLALSCPETSFERGSWRGA